MVKDKDVLKTSIIQGFGTLVVREFFLKILSFIGQIFLARLLAPSDFGVYVVIVFVVNFLSLFSDVGLSLAIIQKHEEPTKEELSGVFILKMILSLLVVTVVWIFAPLLKNFYPTFSVSNVLMLRMLSLIIITGSIRSIPISLLERKLKYNLISIIDIIGVSIYYFISLFFAFMHFGAWSFILGALCKEVGETIVLYAIQPFIPQFSLFKARIKHMIKFGIYIQGNGLVNVITDSITPVIGGRTSGIYSVGLLDFAYNLGTLPETIAVNFGRVAFAGFSRIQKEKEILTNSISRSMSMLAIILYIFPVIIFGLGNELVPIIFSAKWAAAIPALYWYSAGSIFLPIISSLGQGILVIGKSKEIFWATLTTVVTGWLIALVLIHFIGFVGIAVAYFFIVVSFCIFYLLILKRSDYNFPVVSILRPKLLVALLSFLIILALNIILPHGVITLIVKLMVVTISYILLTFIFVRKDAVEFSKIIINWLLPKKI